MASIAALTQLQSLKLTQIRNHGVPAGLPSQLVQLTCLHISYSSQSHHDAKWAPVQWQHLSALAALQDLKIECCKTDADALSGLEHLSHLTSLDLDCLKLESTSMVLSTTHKWACLASLKSLTLAHSRVQPEVFAALQQLSALSLQHVTFQGSRLLELLSIVAQLPLLAHLAVKFDPYDGLTLVWARGGIDGPTWGWRRCVCRTPPYILHHPI
jgi:hypothetical protein